jgi:peptide-methionine (S)-S-oxide reductase
MGEAKQEVAYFGGGCFWCSEALFARRKGVIAVTPGYAGGWTKDPSYDDVCTGTTGHAEVIRIEFDPQVTTFEKLLDYFWKMHDPTTLNRQGHDEGSQYRSIILFTNQEQKKQAEESLKKASKNYKSPIVTKIRPLEAFYEAEEYHKNFYSKNPTHRYCTIVIAPKLANL